MGAASSKSNEGPKFADDFFKRSHRRLERPLRKQFSGGVNYNSKQRPSPYYLIVKIVIRGDAGTGKSTLMKMLQTASLKVANTSAWFGVWGLLQDDKKEIRSSYIPTRQIQVANVKWQYKDSNDVIKVELWDVVDHGHPSVQEKSVGPLRKQEVLDAQSVNVYKQANGVILLFNLGKERSVDYVAKELVRVPPDLPILIIANFADKFCDNDPLFHHRRFVAIRGDNTAPLHFLRGSLTELACPANPPSGLLAAVTKFFELPFLQLQRQILTTRLKINEERNEKAQVEWNGLISPEDDSPGKQCSILMQPPAVRTSHSNIGIDLDNTTTDTLTIASRQAWNESLSSPTDLKNKPNW